MNEINMIWICLGCGLIGWIFAVVCGGPFVAMLSEFWGWSKRKKFMDKFALQVTRLSLICVAMWVILALVVVIWSYYSSFWNILIEIPRNYFYLSAGTFSLGVLFLIIYFMSWRSLNKHKFVHLIFSLFSIICLWSFFYISFNYALQFILQSKKVGTDTCLISVFTGLSATYPIIWPFTSQFILLVFGGTGALSLLYILLRRKKDNFGRDYYRYALASAAKWSFVFPAQVITLVWIDYLVKDQIQFFALPLSFILPFAGLLVCFLILVFLWLRVLRSTIPLRFKGSILFSAVLSWASLSLYTYSCLWLLS